MAHPAAAPDQSAAWTQTALARPLFAHDRRPPAIATAAHTAATPLPRMTATLVTAHGRSAIFAAPAGGKPLVLDEGGHIGAWVVRSIGAGQAVLYGPGGLRIVRISYDGATHTTPRAATTLPPPVLEPGTRVPAGQPDLLRHPATQ